MRLAYSLLLGLSLGVTGGIVRPAPAATSDPPSLPAATVRHVGEDLPYIGAIRDAADPSAAVAAYASAAAAGQDGVRVAKAYLERMIELGVPEMAYAQARDLTQREPEYAAAWAVVADVDARRGQPVSALNEIVTAVQHQPGDPFIQRTAGQLLAWYDTEADQAQASADLKQSLDALRAELGKHTVFAEAYQRAHDFYERAKAAAQSASTNEPPPAEPAPPAPIPDSYVENGYDTYVPPDQTYIYSPYAFGPYIAGYPPYLGYPFSYGSCWWPTEPALVITPGFGFRHHHFDRDDFFWGGAHGLARFDHRGEGDHFRGRHPDFLVQPRHGEWAALTRGGSGWSSTRWPSQRNTWPSRQLGGHLDGLARGSTSFHARPSMQFSNPGPVMPHSYPAPSRSISMPRSFAAPSRSYSMPRSFVAPSRSFAAPSHSFAAPARSFSTPHSSGRSMGGSGSFRGGRR